MINMQNVTYAYPETTQKAVDGVSLQVKPGELVFCTGRSGCGKSTLTRIISGLIPHYHGGLFSGKAIINGQDNLGRNIGDISMDLGIMFQNPETQFFALTVADEVAVALESRSGISRETSEQNVSYALKTMKIDRIAERSVLYLSEGQKQKVALAAILALRPKAIVLDEPSANLDPESTIELASTLATLKESGIAIFIADHRLSWLRGLADRVMVMEHGKLVAQGSFDILDDFDLRQRHGLRDVEDSDCRAELPFVDNTDTGHEFSCHTLGFQYRHAAPVFAENNFRFPKGKVTALIGENGCGKTTLARLCTGLLKAGQGDFFIDKKPLKRKELPRNIGLVLQNADHQLRMQTVQAELEDSLGGTDKNQQQGLVKATLADYALSHLAERHPQSLSGGEKQRLGVAAAMVRNPEAIFLDEPTSGLDGENMRRMAKDLRRAADAGTAVVVITHDLEFIRNICDAKQVVGSVNNITI